MAMRTTKKPKKRRAAPARHDSSATPALITDMDTRNGGVPVGSTPNDSPPVVVKSSSPDPHHPFLTVSDVQDIIDNGRSNGRRLDAANALFQKQVELAQRQLEVQRDTRTAIEGIWATDRAVLDRLDAILVEQRESRLELRQLLDIFVEKTTNGHGDHKIAPKDEERRPVRDDDDRERR